MSKATVTRLFIGGAFAVVAGAILAIVAVVLAIANDVLVMNGPAIVAIRGSALAWSVLGLGLVGGLMIMAGLIAGLVSWIGALLNTSLLESKAWFLALLVLGILSFGLIGMIAYLLAGPDGTSGPSGRRASLAATATVA